MLKLCRKCNEEKPIGLFKKDEECVGGYRHTCNACFKADQRERHARGKGDPAYQARLQKARRKHDLLRKYGVTPETYDELVALQGQCCAICARSSERRLHVDHNHATGVVRGLLCSSCNTLLGHARESAAILSAAITYLKAHGVV